MAAAPSFTCICLQKRLILKDKEETLRKQQEALECLVKHYECDASVVLSGGCILSSKLAIGQAAGFAAAVIGQFENLAQTVAAHLQETEGLASRIPDEAEVICHLYKKYGRTVPHMIKGALSFVLFDPLQARVLAAVTPTSQTPLQQARDSDGSLLITTASRHELPSGSHSVLKICPGYLKYGWSSDPQQYATLPLHSPKSSTPSSRMLAARAALSSAIPEQGDALPSRVSQNSVQTSGPSFADSESGEPQSPAPKKTRRGKRGGKNQKLRAESLKRVTVDELGRLGRTSLDLSTLPSNSLSASSFGSRADEQNWWRTNTPRQSFDLTPNASGSLPSQGSGMQSIRRFSMSAAAPAFVPSQPGLFTRQSVPTVKPQTTALSFPGRTGKPAPANHEAFVVAPKAHFQDNGEDVAMVSPFSSENLVKHRETRGKPQEGKADAAWEEDESPSSSSQQTGHSEGFSSSSFLSSRNSKRASDAFSRMRSEDRVASISEGSTPHKLRLSRVSTAKEDDEIAGDSPEGQSPRGISPGGSPARASKPPKGAFKHFLKSLMPKRSSQLDLPEAARSSSQQLDSCAKASSHGDLTGLHSPAPSRSASGILPGSSGDESHKVTAREDTARDFRGQMLGSQDNLTLSHLKGLKLSDRTASNASRYQPSAAQWLAQKTRSMFSKSKSCTDLHDIERHLNISQLRTEVK